MPESDRETLHEVLQMLVKTNDVRVTKSRRNVNGIYVDAKTADILGTLGVKAKFLAPELRTRLHDDFDFGRHTYSVDTRIANRFSDEPGEKGWALDVLHGAQHLPLSEKGAHKLEMMGATCTLNPTPVDASIDHVRMAMGPGGAIY